MKHDATQHSKFGRLVRRLHRLISCDDVMVETIVVGLLERLWHATTREAYRGDIGKLSNEDIAFQVGWCGDPDTLVNLLVETGWLDEHPDARLVVHDWAEHAPKFVKGNAKKHGGFVVSPMEPSPKEGSPKEPNTAPNLAPPNQTKPNPTEGGRRRQSTGRVEEEIPAPDPAAAYRFCLQVGRPSSRADAELGWKLTALAATLGEAWLANIAEGVRRRSPKKPWAYAWRLAAKGSRDVPGPGDDELRRLLALVRPPPPTWPKSEAAMAERSCATADT